MIELVAHPYPPEIMMARRDQAHITGQPLVERPYWFRDTESKLLFHDLYACLGWPSKVSDRDRGMPGYAAIMGVMRPQDEPIEKKDPRDAKFMVLGEVQSLNVPTLLEQCLKLRKRFGYGVHRDLLKVWYGDPERFIQPLALFNERLRQEQGEGKEILVAPPDDFYTPQPFDNYARSLWSVVRKPEPRLFFGSTTTLKTTIEEFMRDDPIILAAGGLVHTMLNQTLWMEDTSSTIFSVEEEV